MRGQETNGEQAEALALASLGWTLSDSARAGRLLALTGLTPEDLRSRVSDRAVLAAALRVLEGYEPDVVACADAIGVEATRLVEAREALER